MESSANSGSCESTLNAKVQSEPEESSTDESLTDDELDLKIEEKRNYFLFLKREISAIKRRIAAKQKRKTPKCKLIKQSGKFQATKRRNNLGSARSALPRQMIGNRERFHDLPAKHARLLKRANVRGNTRDKLKYKQRKLMVRLDDVVVIKNNATDRRFYCRHCQEYYVIKPLAVSVDKCL